MQLANDNKSKIQWHPAFYATIQIEFKEESHKLWFENEHHLSKKPMQIDVLIIKKRTDDVIHKNIGQIFRKHNIIEYKSPDDYLSIDAFWKVYGYALFYKSESLNVDAIKISELTITYVSMGYPESLMAYLKENLALTIEKQGEGIYYIVNDRIPMQILVSSELSEEENLWLRSLSNNIYDQGIVDRLSKEYNEHQTDECYKAAMNVIVRANREQFEEAKDMCEALREIWAEDIEKAKSEGYEEGQLTGIKCMIESTKELGATWEKVFELVQKKFSVTSEETENYMKLYW